MSKMNYADPYEIKAPEIYLNGDLKIGALNVGTGVFTTTAETATVAISGASVDDIYIVCGEFTSAIDQQDILQWEATANGLTVHRMASGESALKFSWIRIAQ